MTQDDPELARRAVLARVRSTGAQGGRIDPHRAIATIDLGAMDLAGAAALTVLFTGAYLASLGWLEQLWSAVFRVLAPSLGLGRTIGVRTAGTLLRVAMPVFTVQAAPPSRTAWWIALVVTALLVLVSAFLRDGWVPLAYGIRFAAAIQATALLFFAVAPAAFPYDLANYISGMLLLGATLIGVVPLVFGLTFYVIDVSWSRKVGLTVLVMAHLAVLVPLQYALQAALIVHGSLIVLPLLFILFGLLPEIMVLIAWYGWGMSWPSARARGRRQ
jgi:hypothetical protein